MKRFFLIGIVVPLLGLLLACNDDATSPIPPTVAVGRINTITPDSATPTLEPQAQATATAFAEITPSPTPIPTATPLPSERLLLAGQLMFNGDFEQAISQYAKVIPNLGDPGQLSDARLNMAMAQIAISDDVAARRNFERLIADFPEMAEPHYMLAQMAGGDCADALPHYEAYLEREPIMEPYRGPWIAACHLAKGDVESAVKHYETAIEPPAHYLVVYQNRVALAQLYGQQNRFGDAAELYGVIRDAARTAYTRGEMGYFAAEALIAAGDQAGGFAEYQRLLDEHPTLYTTYLGLVELVQAGEPVDEFQRGLVDYYAKVYAPCIDAFSRYLAQDSAELNLEAHRYRAYCYEGVGNVGAALAELDTYTAATGSLSGLAEKADMLRRQGRWPEAIAIYQQIVDPPPAPAPVEEQDSAEADPPTPPLPLADRETARPHALWWLARLHDWRGETFQADKRYQALAVDYPENDNTPHALFRAGFLVNGAGNPSKAIDYWREGALLAPDTPHGRAAMNWASRRTPEDAELRAVAEELRPVAAYYSLRIQHQLQAQPPFAPSAAYEFELDQAAAEAYLREQLDLADDVVIGELSAELRNDPHILRGEKLWRMRQWQLAKQEFEYMRGAYANDALASYQLALYFRDIGLYRSSILAGNAVMDTLGDTVFEAPKFIAGLAYPAYYRDLVLPLAEQYDYDPLLQFALLRQESLYESFATSIAVAQGLAQVIPDTGAYIAQVLNWPNYQNADLYKPYVGLAFGAYYLDEQLARFNEQSHAALAAYNGGPGNAANWYNIAGNDIDQYVETVTFRETRAYIERIYVGHTIYRHLYGVEGINTGE